MSFILNYLDEALDTVTGRYDEHNEENGSDAGSVVGGADGDGGEGERRPPCHVPPCLNESKHRSPARQRTCPCVLPRQKGGYTCET